MIHGGNTKDRLGCKVASRDWLPLWVHVSGEDASAINRRCLVPRAMMFLDRAAYDDEAIVAISSQGRIGCCVWMMAPWAGDGGSGDGTVFDDNASPEEDTVSADSCCITEISDVMFSSATSWDIVRW